MAIVEYIYRKNGSPRWGFQSIVASGENACILHYQENNQPILKGGMMILDIGAEYGYYNADITRSFPVNGRFSDRQKEIYNLVLKCHLAAIDTVKPGISIRDPEKVCLNVLREGLFDLGLITDKESDWQVKIWLPYAISHWLGMDVHDVGEYSQLDHSHRVLEAGMVFTIEPGLYFGEEMFEMIPELYSHYLPEDQLKSFCETVRPAFEKYKNIGVRIEDDILVTNSGHRVLSEKSPRTVKEIESMMKQKSYLNP